MSGGSVVGHGAIVEAGATVSGSILLDGCVVGPGATVIDSVVGPGARVEGGAVLSDVVVGDNAVVGARNELLAGARLWPGVVLPESSVRFSSDV